MSSAAHLEDQEEDVNYSDANVKGDWNLKNIAFAVHEDAR